MRFTLLSLLTIVATFSFGQVKVYISGQIINHTANEIKLQKSQGKALVNILASTIDKDGKFTISGEVPNPDYYKLEVAPKKIINLVLQGNDSIKVYSDESNIMNFTNIIGSKPSQQILSFLSEYQIHQGELKKLNTLAQKNPAKKDSVLSVLKYRNTIINSKRDRFARDNRQSPALIVILGMYDKEKEFKQYSQTASQLIASFPKSPTMVQVKKELDYYKAKNESASATGIGKDAPEIDMTDTTRNANIKLSSLKGKVVLIDFWASWCGPCRRENPTVVKMYEKYKDHGFTVYSVSLDSQLDRWKKAIEQDNLSWPNHVSDLQRFNSSGGRTYGVSSIPSTFLIGKDGKIMDKNLRGVRLEQVLKSIFGF